jgi:hypothetical protein
MTSDITSDIDQALYGAESFKFKGQKNEGQTLRVYAACTAKAIEVTEGDLWSAFWKDKPQKQPVNERNRNFSPAEV